MQEEQVNVGESERQVESLEFSTLTSQDIIKMSETLIYNSRIYDRESHEIIPHGPLDNKMGVGNKQNTCGTCHKKLLECGGHFGVMRFSLPVYHLGYFRVVVQLLQGVCRLCSHLMLDDSQRQELTERQRGRANWTTNRCIKHIKEVIDASKKNLSRPCPNCHQINQHQVRKVTGQPCKVVLQSIKQIIKSKREEDDSADEQVHQTGNQDIDAIMARRILASIPQRDLILLGFAPDFQADELVSTVLAVPPVQIRPTVPIGFGSTNEDDLTVKVSEMVQFSNDISKNSKQGQENNKLNNDWFLLQSVFVQYLNSNAPGLPLQILGNKGIRALFQRLKGKHGRFRGNLSGKRVNFSGRTVISPDPNIEIDEVVVPMHMAKILTYPERVNALNKKSLQQMILNGREKYPGANYVMTKKGRVDLKFAGRRRQCDELQIGEVVERHLRDGDIVLFNRQPSLHRQSIMSHRVRVQEWNTLRFNECVCTPYNADFDGDEMNIHLPQDYLASGEANQLMCVSTNLRTPKSGELLVALTQDFLTSAYLLTNRDTMFTRSEFCQIACFLNNANEKVEMPVPTVLKPVELWTGKQLVSLILRPNRLSQVVVNLVNKERQYQNKKEEYCLKDGYVVFQNSELLLGQLGKNTLGGSKAGLFYTLLRDNGRQVTSKIMGRFARLSARLIGEMGMTISAQDVTPNSMLSTTKESLVQEAYLKCQQQISKYHNKELELKAGCDYEQTLESNMNGLLSRIRDDLGELCRRTMTADNKPLIMYTCGSKGSIINLCQMIGCVGQQVLNGKRVPDGFTDRTLPHFPRLTKQPEAKGFVKNSYYEGLKATEFFFHTMAGREGLIDTSVKTAETGYMQRRLMKSLEDLKVGYDYSVRQEQGGQIVQFLYGEDGLDPMKTDNNEAILDLPRLLQNCITVTRQYHHPTINKQQLSRLVQQHMNDPHKIIALDQVSARFKQQLDQYWATLLQDYQGGLDRPTIDLFFTQLWVKYSRCLAVPGEAAGVVTGQSIGEPGTQMTLKTFHFAGVASMNVTMGVPRLKEIINAASKITTPLITARLIYPQDKLGARVVRARIEKTYLGDICQHIKEVYGPTGVYLSLSLSEQAVSNLNLNLTTQEIKAKIMENTSTKFRLTEQNVQIKKDWKIHIMAQTQKPQGGSQLSNNNLFFMIQQLKKILPEIVVKGIPTIQRAVIQKMEEDEESVQIIVEGQGLKEVMRIPGIDANHTKSNGIVEVYETLGIEAARQTIYNEMQYVMGAHGLAVDSRHIALLSEVMAQSGQVAGITRFGLQKTKHSVLMLSSFEKTTEVLYDSALFNQKDPLKGVSEAIIVGKRVPLGTNSFDIMLDMQLPPATTPPPQDYLFQEIVY